MDWDGEARPGLNYSQSKMRQPAGQEEQKDFLESIWSAAGGAADELTGVATTPTKYLQL